MFTRDKLPFILLGLGIGIILVNTIYMFNPNIEYKDYTEEEIVQLATDLGMVFIKDNIDILPKKDEESFDNKGVREIVFIIDSGDTLEKVSKELFNLGIIEDFEKFYKFAKDKNIEKKIRVGTYKLLPETDYETIIKTITKN